MEFYILLTKVVFYESNRMRLTDNYKRYTESSVVPKYAIFLIQLEVLHLFCG